MLRPIWKLNGVRTSKRFKLSSKLERELTDQLFLYHSFFFSFLHVQRACVCQNAHKCCNTDNTTPLHFVLDSPTYLWKNIFIYFDRDNRHMNIDIYTILSDKYELIHKCKLNRNTLHMVHIAWFFVKLTSENTHT